MMEIREAAFIAALNFLASEIPDLIQELNEDSFGSISKFDNALVVVMELRNDFCQAAETPIENGSIDWEKSEAQISYEEENGDDA